MIIYIIVFIEAFLDTLDSKHTRRAYGSDLRLLESRTATSLVDATESTVRELIDVLQERNESLSTIRRRLSALRAFYDWLYERGERSHNPARHVKVKAETDQRTSPPSPLTKSDVQVLLDAAPVDTKHGARTRALILTVVFGMLRRQEVASLDAEDIRPLGRHWIIDLESPNGRGGYVSLPSTAVQAIDRVIAQFNISNGALWRSLSNRSYGQRLSPESIYEILSQAGQESEIESPVTIDGLRRAGMMIATSAGVRLEEVQAHARLQHPQSVTAQTQTEEHLDGLNPRVPSRIEDALQTEPPGTE